MNYRTEVKAPYRSQHLHLRPLVAASIVISSWIAGCSEKRGSQQSEQSSAQSQESQTKQSSDGETKTEDIKKPRVTVPDGALSKNTEVDIKPGKAPVADDAAGASLLPPGVQAIGEPYIIAPRDLSATIRAGRHITVALPISDTASTALTLTVDPRLSVFMRVTDAATNSITIHVWPVAPQQFGAQLINGHVVVELPWFCEIQLGRTPIILSAPISALVSQSVASGTSSGAAENESTATPTPTSTPSTDINNESPDVATEPLSPRPPRVCLLSALYEGSKGWLYAVDTYADESCSAAGLSSSFYWCPKLYAHEYSEEAQMYFCGNPMCSTTAPDECTEFVAGDL